MSAVSRWQTLGHWPITDFNQLLERGRLCVSSQLIILASVKSRYGLQRRGIFDRWRAAGPDTADSYSR